jgi:hypothetical protein
VPTDKKQADELLYLMLGQHYGLSSVINQKHWSQETIEMFSQFRASSAQLIRDLAPPGSPHLTLMQQAIELPTPDLTSLQYAAAQLKGILAALREDYKNDRIGIAHQSEIPALLHIEKLLSRFHLVAQQLQNRRDGRPTLVIADEYDIQDLLYALLRLEFEDIRLEDPTPQSAGKSARMDFVLKNHGIVIEVKKTRDRLADKELGDQLLLDIARYKARSDCQTLVCFIYDPDRRIQNPAGLKHDLEASRADGFSVVVHVCPR